jgi:O-antigen/teichoic acid export membrane protein
VIRRALLYSLGQRYLAFVLQLATSMVVARLLTPGEIGIYSLAATAVTVGHVIRDFGIGDYLIKEREITHAKTRAAFTVTTLFAWLMAALFALAAPWVAQAYDEPALRTVLYLLSLNFVLIPFCTTAMALLVRAMDFRPVFWVQTGGTVLGSVVTVVLALQGLGVLSLALGAVTAVLGTIAGLLWVGWRNVLLKPTVHGLRGVFGFGGTLTVARLAEELSEKCPDFFISALLGFHANGLYSKAATLNTAFQDFFTAAVDKVALPVLARKDAAGPELWALFSRASQMLLLVQCAFFAYLLICADEIIWLLFGPQWGEAAVLVRAGAVGGLLWAPCALANSLLTSQGHAAVQMRVNLVYGALLVAVVALGAQHSLLAVAVGVQGAVAVRTGMTLLALRRHLGFGPRLVLGALSHSLGLAGMAGMLGWGAHELAAQLGLGTVAMLLLPAATGTIALWLLGSRAEHPLMAEVKRALVRRAGGRTPAG